ncbi:MAG: hypothetical protein ABW044_05385 [Cellvibrio sp.]
MNINPVKVRILNGRFLVIDSRDNYLYGQYSEEMANRVAVQANKRISQDRKNSGELIAHLSERGNLCG